MANFNLEKQNALIKIDKSHEQQWDDKIKPLCNEINKHLDYFTTSSCAGRITLLKTSTKKIKNAFLYKTHDFANPQHIWKIILENRNQEILYLRQEPAALHVACKTFKDAINLIDIAKKSGFKRSGIISNNKKFICEIVSTEWIVAPVIIKSEILVNEKFILEAIIESNKKLEKTWHKIENLTQKFVKTFSE